MENRSLLLSTREPFGVVALVALVRFMNDLSVDGVRAELIIPATPPPEGSGAAFWPVWPVRGANVASRSLCREERI